MRSGRERLARCNKRGYFVARDFVSETTFCGGLFSRVVGIRECKQTVSDIVAVAG